MKIIWLNDITGLDLKPVWEVDKVLIHQIDHYRGLDGKETPRKAVFLVIKATAEQMRKLKEDYVSIPFNILGIQAIELKPGAVLWTWKAPEGYPSIKDGNYTAFEIID